MSIATWIIAIALGMACAGAALFYALYQFSTVYDQDMGLDAEDRDNEH